LAKLLLIILKVKQAIRCPFFDQMCNAYQQTMAKKHPIEVLLLPTSAASCDSSDMSVSSIELSVVDDRMKRDTRRSLTRRKRRIKSMTDDVTSPTRGTEQPERSCPSSPTSQLQCRWHAAEDETTRTPSRPPCRKRSSLSLADLLYKNGGSRLEDDDHSLKNKNASFYRFDELKTTIPCLPRLSLPRLEDDKREVKPEQSPRLPRRSPSSSFEDLIPVLTLPEAAAAAVAAAAEDGDQEITCLLPAPLAFDCRDSEFTCHSIPKIPRRRESMSFT